MVVAGLDERAHESLDGVPAEEPIFPAPQLGKRALEDPAGGARKHPSLRGALALTTATEPSARTTRWSRSARPPYHSQYGIGVPSNTHHALNESQSRPVLFVFLCVGESATACVLVFSLNQKKLTLFPTINARWSVSTKEVQL